MDFSWKALLARLGNIAFFVATAAKLPSGDKTPIASTIWRWWLQADSTIWRWWLRNVERGAVQLV